MSAADLEARIAALSRAEKASLVERLANDLAASWPGIERTPGVSGGEACVVRTRIPVWTLVAYRQQGWSEARLLDAFPSLRAADLVHAWAYFDSHQEEIEAAIRSQSEA